MPACAVIPLVPTQSVSERGVAGRLSVDFALFSPRVTRYIPARMIDVPRPGGTQIGDCG